MKMLPSLSQFQRETIYLYGRNLIQAMVDKNIPLEGPCVKKKQTKKKALVGDRMIIS